MRCRCQLFRDTVNLQLHIRFFCLAPFLHQPLARTLPFLTSQLERCRERVKKDRDSVSSRDQHTK